LLQPYIDNLEILETKIDEFAAPSLDRRFETLPALTRVTLGEVKDQLIAVTELLLEQRFDSLGQSFGEYLIECAVSAVDQPIETFKFKRDELEAWGEQLQFNEDRFVLDLSNLAPPSFSVPISFGDLLCLIFGVNCS
jgi:hypothetical protein